MGTVHAHLISNIVPRLSNDQIGLSRQALTGPQIINLLIYQALVSTLCKICAEPTEMAIARSAEIVEIVQILKHKLQLPTDQLRWQRPGGCLACRGRGVQGKTIVAELFQPDRQWLMLVRDNDDYGALSYYRSLSDGDLLSNNMTGKTVFEHALWKALHGLIDVRCCEAFESLRRYEPPSRPRLAQCQEKHTC